MSASRWFYYKNSGVWNSCIAFSQGYHLVVIDVEAETEDIAATPLPIHCLLSLDKRTGISVAMNTMIIFLRGGGGYSSEHF